MAGKKIKSVAEIEEILKGLWRLVDKEYPHDFPCQPTVKIGDTEFVAIVSPMYKRTVEVSIVAKGERAPAIALEINGVGEVNTNCKMPLSETDVAKGLKNFPLNFIALEVADALLKGERASKKPAKKIAKKKQ